jgi:hypothetical protein
MSHSRNKRKAEAEISRKDDTKVSTASVIPKRPTIQATVNLVGLMVLNDEEDVKIRGYIKLPRGAKLKFNRDPDLIGRHDENDTLDNAVKFLSAEEELWEDEALGHMATLCTAPDPR